MKHLMDLFEAELRELYDAEHRILEALETLAKVTTDSDAKKVFAQHLEESRRHVARLTEVFRHLDVPPTRDRCHAIAGLFDSHARLIAQEPAPRVLDLARIMTAIRAERYEISTYEALSDMAVQLNLGEVAELLDENLEDEEAALEQLVGVRQTFDVSEIAASRM